MKHAYALVLKPPDNVSYTSGYGCYLKESEVTTMRQHVNGVKHNRCSDVTYNPSEHNKITASNQMEQTLCKMESQKFEYDYQGKRVNIVIEYPISSDKKAELEFMELLKNIYMENLKKGAMKKEGSALEFPPTDNEVEKFITKEDEEHE